MKINLIKANAQMVIDTCDHLIELHNKRENVKASPYYETFGSQTELEQDLEKIDIDINVNETILTGLLK